VSGAAGFGGGVRGRGVVGCVVGFAHDLVDEGGAGCG
jgi:hypothetical protein